MNINLQKFNNFKKFVEYEVGLNTPLYDYNEEEFTATKFMNFVLQHPNKKVEEKNCKLFNEGKYFEIIRVLLFLEFLDEESFFIWDVEEYVIDEYEDSFCRRSMNCLTEYYLERYKLWEQKKEEEQHPLRVTLTLPENKEILLHTPLGKQLKKAFSQMEHESYPKRKITIQYKQDILEFGEHHTLDVYEAGFCVVSIMDKCYVYSLKNVQEINYEEITQKTIYEGRQ